MKHMILTRNYIDWRKKLWSVLLIFSCFCVLGKQLAQDFYSYNGGYKGGEYKNGI